MSSATLPKFKWPFFAFALLSYDLYSPDFSFPKPGAEFCFSCTVFRAILNVHQGGQNTFFPIRNAAGIQTNEPLSCYQKKFYIIAELKFGPCTKFCANPGIPRGYALCAHNY